MKKNTLICFLISIVFIAYSQEKSERNLGNTQLFSEKSGVLIEKTFIDIGKLKGVEIHVLKLKNLNDNTTISGIKFKDITFGTYSDSYSAFLDADELDGLIKSLEFFNHAPF